MHVVQLAIKNNYTKKDGTTPIYLEYYFTRKKRKVFKTGKNIDPKYWNPNQKEVRKTHEHYKEINLFLKTLKHKMETIVDEARLKGILPTPSYVEEQFTMKVSPEKIITLNFMDRFDEFIEVKTGKVVIDVIKDYKSLLKHLKGFQTDSKKEILFREINIKFYDEFVNYLEYKVKKRNGEVGLQKSTVGKSIKNLKVFINHCVRYGHIELIDLSDFKILNSNAKDIYITEEELDELLALDLSDNPQFEEIRDMFVIGCETGLRYSDLSTLSSKHITDKYIRITMKKNLMDGVIPISKRLRLILEKYNNNPPSNISSHEFNKHIKTIGEKAGIKEYVTKFKLIGNKKIPINKMKYHFISSHTCRRSFCTNQFKRRMPTLLIRKISGHADERSFLKYIKITEEEAARMMLEMWEEMEK